MTKVKRIKEIKKLLKEAQLAEVKMLKKIVRLREELSTLEVNPKQLKLI